MGGPDEPWELKGRDTMDDSRGGVIGLSFRRTWGCRGIAMSERCRFALAGRALLAAVLASVPGVALGQSAEDFFKTATLSMHVGSGSGGGYDAVARLVA